MYTDTMDSKVSSEEIECPQAGPCMSTRPCCWARFVLSLAPICGPSVRSPPSLATNPSVQFSVEINSIHVRKYLSFFHGIFCMNKLVLPLSIKIQKMDTNNDQEITENRC